MRLPSPPAEADHQESLLCASAGITMTAPEKPSRPARFVPPRTPHEAAGVSSVSSAYVRWFRPLIGSVLVAGMALPVAAAVAGEHEVGL